MAGWIVLAMVLWGIGWPALKVVTDTDVPVETVTFLRFAIMAVSFLPILYWRRKPLRLNRRTLRFTIAAGALNVAFMYFAFWGVQTGSAGAGGVIITVASPILTALLALIVFRTRVSPTQLLGLGVGLFGGMLMLEVWHADLLHSGNVFFIGSALVWAVLTLLGQQSHTEMEPIHFNFWLAVFAVPITFVPALPAGLGTVYNQDWTFWTGLLFLAIMGQTVASTIFFVAAGKIGSAKAGSYMFLVPLTALVASFLLLGERPSFWLVAGGAVSTAAVYFINARKR
ncbi:DMT family transporter [Sulfurimonas sp. HSL-3221]|uniref:DMT family transporter n=1 Tax=Thiomicrolovo sulfuroxydans TaxID=2894755 RepID=UPI001E636781|nr:DMT family transporter [Sulfurimonas sp. HSL-3221]UFS63224.1 DMT family transporter [Sulfurimonas sp. HSL-3221]